MTRDHRPADYPAHRKHRSSQIKTPAMVAARPWVLPVALLALTLLPALGASQVTGSGEELRREWIEIQSGRDRQVKMRWWRDLDPGRLRAFVEAGADVNATDARGWTPLHSAARYSPDPAIVLALLEAGAVVDARDRAGDTPLHWAAAENDDVGMVTALLEAGADVNARDRFGWLPIHTAAESSANPEIIDVLLTAGAKRNRRAYFVLFSPAFLLKHNANMSKTDKEAALARLRGAD